MNRFAKKSFARRLLEHFPIAIIIFAIIMGCFIYGVSTVAGNEMLDEEKILSNALTKDIVHCYATEGIYPPSLSYIEEHYGLIYDKDKYLISYENVGSNILPVVHIFKK